MADTMFDFDPELAGLVISSCLERLAAEEVPLNRPGAKPTLDAALAGLISHGGSDPADLLAIFKQWLAPAVISCDSPRFLSFIPTAPTKASVLFDMVVSCWSLRGISWLVSSGAVAAENQVLGLLAELSGLPGGAGGTFVTGGSAGNLSAMIVARDSARRHATGPARTRVAVSDQAHSSILKALHVVGLEPLVVPTGGEPLTATILEAAIAGQEGDLAAVVATAGSTNAGLIDDLEGIGALAREIGAWFHVDAAYGGAGLFSERVRPRFRGLRHADSLVVDPHKWLFAPLDCAALIYRQPHLAKQVHTQQAPFLDALHTGTPEEWNPSDYAYQFTRRARGLPLWFSLALHGTDAYRDAVDAGIDLATGAARLISSRPYLQLVREPELSVVLFRRSGWSSEDYHRWSAQLLDEQVAFVVPTVWCEETVARLCFLHPKTSLEIVVEILDSMAPGPLAPPPP